jgi:valyl-tRNA synthetase
MAKAYNAEETEKKIREFWEKEKIYKFDPKRDRKIYSIDTPPPTVSGKMHMGHAFGNSQQDFIARFKRMKGFNVLQPFGTDDNGLPTKLLIENLKKVDAAQMPRKEFVKLVLETLEKELRPKYLEDWKKLGISCDFDVFYTTINEHCRKISQKSFIDLYKKGRQYRQEAAAMYCPKCQTAISQVECEDKEKHSAFNDIIFKAEGKDLVIATTRPELLPACVAIFYHPDDKRYQKLKNKMAKVPLFDFEVPILEDARADPEKGTGIVMCCTFGDATDAEWQKAHNLPVKEAIDKKGKMTALAGEYKGLEIEEARKKIIEELKKKKLLIKQEPITHAVNVHERCGTAIEFIHSKQWFVKYLDLRDQMLKWGEELNWHPEHMKNRYENWVKGLQWDWCISRQLPYGIPFPVWYCKECDEVIPAEEKDLPVDPTEDKPPVKECPKCQGKEFIPEKDIINTWATSSLTPTIVKELFRGTKVYDYLIKNPMDLRPQGHDIITFWLFNTVVKSQLHFNMLPWKDCFINGWMLDPKGKKMSKSKGNIIEPQEMIEKYSADALRFMAGSSKLGEDLPFPEKDLVAGKKFLTKLWNASNFVFMNLEDYKREKPKELEEIDKLFLSKLSLLIATCTENFEKYEFSKVKLDIEKFFWHDFCDNYLEIVKKRIYNETGNKKTSAQYTLYKSLLTILKLIAPITPFITEEIYQQHFKENEKDKSIHLSSWPEAEDSTLDLAPLELFIEILTKVRQEKTNAKTSMRSEIILALPKKEQEKLGETINDLKDVTNSKEIKTGKFAVKII